MGNGAATGKHNPLSYAALETVLQHRRHSPHDEEDLRSVFAEAINHELLDVMELLLAREPALAARINPVRLAAQSCKPESLDLLINAGMYDESTHQDSESPLHLVAKCSNTPEEASLCAALLLGIGGDNLVRTKTARTSETILHVAARYNNQQFIQTVTQATSVIQMTKLLAAKNSEGKTPTQIALSLGHAETLREFDLIRSGGSAPRETPVIDQARIMLVFERFFENVTRRMMGEELLEMEAPTVIATLERSQLPVQSQRESRKASVSEWWNQILCYSYSDNSCYLVDKRNGSARWLDEYVESGRLDFSSKFKTQGIDGLPRNFRDACDRGFVSYFDLVANRTTFFSLAGWSVIPSLPLGDNRKRCADLNFVLSEEDAEWVSPDPVCENRWVQVSRTRALNIHRRDEDEKWSDWDKEIVAEESVYYYNLLTGQSSSSAPPNWCVYDGWLLCAEEDSIEHLFWYSSATGESVWCEKL